jgi:cysteine desulfurase/selenocysteine lyase
MRVYGDKPLVYLDNAATTHKPRQVLQAMQDFYTTGYSNIHRGVHYLSAQASEVYEQARHRVATFLNAAHDEEIVFTHGTTDAINLAAEALGELIEPDSQIVVSAMEHHSNLLPWQRLSRRCGAELIIIPLTDDGALDIDAYNRLMNPRVCLVALTCVSNILGVRTPIEQIVDKAHRYDAYVLLDGAQAVQHMPVDVQALGCDLFAFSGHKIYADTGIGVLYGRKNVLEAMCPAQMGGGMVDTVEDFRATYAPPPLRFEAGTPHIAGAVSLAAALSYVEQLGRQQIMDHELRLLAYARERLRAIDGLSVYADTQDAHGAISCNFEGLHPYDVGTLLDKMGIAVRTGTHCAQLVLRHFGITGTLRASIALYTTYDDIDRLVQGMEKARRMLQ